jgi:TolB-like protein/class 3 adenylate cyclase
MPEPATEQRKLAAIMFTDMVGYSAMAQRNEALALDLLEEHRRLLRAIFPNHRGLEIKTTGDGFMVEFASAVEAARCAVEIQDALATRNATQPAQRRVLIRIGIHVGDVVQRGQDVFGDGVNIAARIEPLAEAGGICVSQQVYDQIRNKIENPLIRFGVGELKNIRLPVVIYKLALSAAPIQAALFPRLSFLWRQRRVRRWAVGALVVLLVGWVGLQGWRWASGGRLGASPSRASIAVLPFVNLSSDKENEYLSDGLTEELINALAKMGTLRVASRTSSFAFKGKSEDVQKIGEQLRVRTILEGSVRKAGAKLRITVQLVNVSDGYHLWPETYEKDSTDVFALQTDVAQRVTDVLKDQLRTGDLWGGIGALRTGGAGQ